MIAIHGTTLAITGIRLLQQQDALFSDARETLTIYEITDMASGLTGHVTHELSTEKRDIARCALFTDNPALFEDNKVESDWPNAYDYSTAFTPAFTNKRTWGAVPTDVVKAELAVDDDGWYWELAH